MKKHLYFLPLLGALLLLGNVDIQSLKSEDPIAIVRRFKPTVTIDNENYEKAKELKLGDDEAELLYSGDSLRTAKDGYAYVVFMDKSIAKVKPNSLLVVQGERQRNSKRSNSRIDLKLGEIFLEVEPQGTNDFEVATSRSLASVKGTEFGSTSDGYVWVREGQVDVTALQSGETVSLFEKMYAQVNQNGNEIESGTLTDDELNNLDDGYEEMEKDLVKKEMKFRFIDANGQVQEITIEYYEKGGQ